MLVLNVSSVAVLWFGGHRVDAGDDADRCPDGLPVLPHADPDVGHDGHLHAGDGPARRRLRRPHRTRSSTPSPRSSPPTDPVTAPCDGPRDCRAARRATFSYPGADAPVLRDISFTAGPGRTTADHRQHRRGQDDPALADPAAVRRHRGPGARRRGRRARARPRRPLTRHRTGPAEGVPVLRHRSPATCATASPTPRTTSCGGARAIAQAEDFVERCADGLDAPSPRAARTSPVDSGSGWRSRGPWCGVRRSTCSTTRSPRSTWRTDARLRAALRPVTADSTVLVVAQRVSTIIEADQILVLDDGAWSASAARGAAGPARPTRDRAVAAPRGGGGGMSTATPRQPPGQVQREPQTASR